VGNDHPDVKRRQESTKKSTKVLGDAYADKYERIQSQAPDELLSTYNESIKLIEELFKDANEGLNVPLIACRLPGGTVTSGLTSAQCQELGGAIAEQ
jgi:hypothetical protein